MVIFSNQFAICVKNKDSLPQLWKSIIYLRPFEYFSCDIKTIYLLSAKMHVPATDSFILLFIGSGDLPSTRKSARTRKQPKKSAIAGDSDDDGDDNDYDYDDSFIDDNMDAESESCSYDDDDCEDEDWSPDELK